MKEEMLKQKEEELRQQVAADKKKGKKSFWIFLIILIAAFFIGGIAGMITFGLKGGAALLQAYTAQIYSVCAIVVPTIMVVFDVVMTVICFVQYGSLKKRVVIWMEQGEDEEELDRIELRMNQPIAFTTIGMIINFFLVAVNWKLDSCIEEPSVLISSMVMLGNLAFVLGLVVQLMIQNLVVNLEKQLNPEKRGSVFDLRFQEEWINSCDEAERLIEYRAGFQAYKIGQYVCIGMWVLCIMAQFAFNTGVFPVACVTVIWMVLVCVYLTEHIRLERKSRGLSK